MLFMHGVGLAVTHGMKRIALLFALSLAACGEAPKEQASPSSPAPVTCREVPKCQERCDELYHSLVAPIPPQPEPQARLSQNLCGNTKISAADKDTWPDPLFKYQ